MERSNSCQPECAAVSLVRIVDERINGGARQEFNAATDTLQPLGADLGGGSAYLDTSEISFVPRTLKCILCSNVAHLFPDGSVMANGCGLTGRCELEWARRYPESYRDISTGAMGGQVSCGAEVGCAALIGVTTKDNTLEAVLRSGVCQVAWRGDNWEGRGRNALDRELLVTPDQGIAPFDGVDSGREEPS